MGYLQRRAGGAPESLFQGPGEAGPGVRLAGLLGLWQGALSATAVPLCGKLPVWLRKGSGGPLGGFLASEESRLYRRALGQAGGDPGGGALRRDSPSLFLGGK